MQGKNEGKSDYFHPETLKRISRLELRARYVVEGFLSGMHKSRHFGNSVEFRQHRQYVPGDDPRNVDWKVWAKQDRLYVKQYEVDTNLRCTLLLDVSRSMQYGSRALSKYDYACTLAASIAYLAMRQQDAVGCITFEKEIESILPARTKQSQLGAILAGLRRSDPGERLPGQDRASPGDRNREEEKKRDEEKLFSFEELLANYPVMQADLKETLRATAQSIPKYGLVVLISDLFVRREGLFQGLRFLRSREHDVLVLHVLDDEELDFTFGGPTRFEGLELPARIRCDPRMLRPGYLESLNAYLEEVRRGCSENQADYALFRTSQPLDAALSAYLSRRNAVLRNRMNRTKKI